MEPMLLISAPSENARETSEYFCPMCRTAPSRTSKVEVQQIACNVRAFADLSFSVWRCPGCRSLHAQDAVDVTEYYHDYPMHRQKFDLAARFACAKRLRQLRKHGLRAGHSVLDYGCGGGIFVTYLRERGYEAAGYDPYIEEFDRPSLLHKRYDVVLTQDVIEHVENPHALMLELESLIRPGGLLVIGTPNADEIDMSRPEEFSFELHQPYHRHILSESALLRLARSVGFSQLGIARRFSYDTPLPMMNLRFIKRYVQANGGHLDALFEKPQVGKVLASPLLMLAGLSGAFSRAPGNMVMFFRHP
jgi:2-polyprenyl-3-methyl-5-hydroxy-6-metoxy-1,4-benzoquinol methylase